MESANKIFVHAVCAIHDTCHRVYVVKIDGSVGFAKMI